MKILVITRNAWDDTNAIGSTLSNFFRGMEDIQLANVYFRAASPCNQLCTDYFQITETDVLKNWLTPERIGRTFSQQQKLTRRQEQEKKLVHFIRRWSLRGAYRLADSLWYSEKWCNTKLDDFICRFQPDVMVTLVKAAPQYYLTVRYLRELFHIPLLAWIADDEYTALRQKKAKRQIENLRYILREAAVVRGCSREVCDYYRAVFGCTATPLYKGCEPARLVKAGVHDPIRLVYGGNLLYGRLEVLCAIARVLEEMEGACLEIYSNTPLPPRERAFFDGLRRTKYRGKQAHSAVCERLAEADIALHVESFEEKQVLKTRYSFSAKVMDCLQSGSVVLAVGPAEQASVAFLRTVPGTCVIHRPEQIKPVLKQLLSNRDQFLRRAELTRCFVQTHHDARVNCAQLRQTLQHMTEGER